MDLAVDHRRGRSGNSATCAANAVNKRTSGNCKCVTFHKRGGRAVSAWRCDSRKLRAHNRNQCRAGTGKSFKAHRFVKRLANGKCPRRA